MQDKRSKGYRGEVMAKYQAPFPEGRKATNKDYLPWGTDNLEPLRWLYYGRHCGTLSSCLSKKALFIEGNGFTDTTFYRAKINRRGLKVDGMLRHHAKDLATWRGIAIHINYGLDRTTGLIKATEFNYVPIRKLRLGQPDDADFISKVYVVDNADSKEKKKITETQYDVFNPDQEVLKEQVRAAGGFQYWNGQIFYAFDTDTYYPWPHWMSVETSIETEMALEKSKRADAADGFSAKTIITSYVNDPDDIPQEVIERDKEAWGGFKGPDGGRIMKRYAASKDSKDDIDKLQADDLAENYEYAENSAADKIYNNFGIPKLLYGIEVSGKLGTSGEFEDACKYVQRFVVNSDQRLIMEAYEQVFQHHARIAEINPSANYNIENLTITGSNGTATNNPQ